MNKKWVRRIAWISLFFFLSSDAGGQASAWAQLVPSETFPSADLSENVFHPLPAIPEPLGSISETHAGDGPLLVHLQTAHGNYQAQRQIFLLLRFLKNTYGIDTVFEEGTGTDLKPRILRLFPENMALTHELADRMVRRGLVKGADLFLIAEPAARGFGIEETSLYRKNREAFKDVLRQSMRSRGFLQEMHQSLEKLISPYMNRSLRQFLMQREAQERGRLPLSSWIHKLKDEALRLKIADLDAPEQQLDWPMLVRLFKLESLEKRIDRQALSAEREKFLRQSEPYLSKHPEILRALHALLNLNPGSPDPGPETSRIVETAAALLPQDFPYAQFPNLNRQLGFFMLQSEMESGLLSREVEKLEGAVREALCENDTERTISDLVTRRALLEKLLALELVPAEHEKILAAVAEYRPSALIEQFHAADRERRLREMNFSHAGDLDLLFDRALEFYKLAKERDHAMAEKLRGLMKTKGIRKAAVITGGFHAAPFADYFKAQGFRYLQVSPRLDEIHETADRKTYLRMLFQNESPAARATLETSSPLLMPGEITEHGSDPAFELAEELRAVADYNKTARVPVRPEDLAATEHHRAFGYRIPAVLNEAAIVQLAKSELRSEHVTPVGVKEEGMLTLLIRDADRRLAEEGYSNARGEPRYLLTQREELALLRTYQAEETAEIDRRRAAELLTYAQLRTLVSLAKKFYFRSGGTVAFADLLEESQNAFGRAIGGYDAERINPKSLRPYRLSTLTHTAVSRALSRFVTTSRKKTPYQLDGMKAEEDLVAQDDGSDSEAFEDLRRLTADLSPHLNDVEAKVFRLMVGIGSSRQSREEILMRYTITPNYLNRIEKSLIRKIAALKSPNPVKEFAAIPRIPERPVLSIPSLRVFSKDPRYLKLAPGERDRRITAAVYGLDRKTPLGFERAGELAGVSKQGARNAVDRVLFAVRRDVEALERQAMQQPGDNARDLGISPVRLWIVQSREKVREALEKLRLSKTGSEASEASAFLKKILALARQARVANVLGRSDFERGTLPRLPLAGEVRAGQDLSSYRNAFEKMLDALEATYADKSPWMDRVFRVTPGGELVRKSELRAEAEAVPVEVAASQVMDRYSSDKKADGSVWSLFFPGSLGGVNDNWVLVSHGDGNIANLRLLHIREDRNHPEIQYRFEADPVFQKNEPRFEEPVFASFGESSTPTRQEFMVFNGYYGYYQGFRFEFKPQRHGLVASRFKEFNRQDQLGHQALGLAYNPSARSYLGIFRDHEEDQVDARIFRAGYTLSSAASATALRGLNEPAPPVYDPVHEWMTVIDLDEDGEYVMRAYRWHPHPLAGQMERGAYREAGEVYLPILKNHDFYYMANVFRMTMALRGTKPVYVVSDSNNRALYVFEPQALPDGSSGLKLSGLKLLNILDLKPVLSMTRAEVYKNDYAMPVWAQPSSGRIIVGDPKDRQVLLLPSLDELTGSDVYRTFVGFVTGIARLDLRAMAPKKRTFFYSPVTFWSVPGADGDLEVHAVERVGAAHYVKKIAAADLEHEEIPAAAGWKTVPPAVSVKREGWTETLGHAHPDPRFAQAGPWQVRASREWNAAAAGKLQVSLIREDGSVVTQEFKIGGYHPYERQDVWTAVSAQGKVAILHVYPNDEYPTLWTGRVRENNGIELVSDRPEGRWLLLSQQEKPHGLFYDAAGRLWTYARNADNERLVSPERISEKEIEQGVSAAQPTKASGEEAHTELRTAERESQPSRVKAELRSSGSSETTGLLLRRRQRDLAAAARYALAYRAAKGTDPEKIGRRMAALVGGHISGQDVSRRISNAEIFSVWEEVKRDAGGDFKSELEVQNGLKERLRGELLYMFEPADFFKVADALGVRLGFLLGAFVMHAERRVVFARQDVLAESRETAYAVLYHELLEALKSAHFNSDGRITLLKEGMIQYLTFRAMARRGKSYPVLDPSYEFMRLVVEALIVRGLPENMITQYVFGQISRNAFKDAPGMISSSPEGKSGFDQIIDLSADRMFVSLAEVVSGSPRKRSELRNTGDSGLTREVMLAAVKAGGLTEENLGEDAKGFYVTVERERHEKIDQLHAVVRALEPYQGAYTMDIKPMVDYGDHQLQILRRTKAETKKGGRGNRSRRRELRVETSAPLDPYNAAVEDFLAARFNGRRDLRVMDLGSGAQPQFMQQFALRFRDSIDGAYALDYANGRSRLLQVGVPREAGDTLPEAREVFAARGLFEEGLNEIIRDPNHFHRYDLVLVNAPQGDVNAYLKEARELLAPGGQLLLRFHRQNSRLADVLRYHHEAWGWDLEEFSQGLRGYPDSRDNSAYDTLYVLSPRTVSGSELRTAQAEEISGDGRQSDAEPGLPAVYEDLIRKADPRQGNRPFWEEKARKEQRLKEILKAALQGLNPEKTGRQELFERLQAVHPQITALQRDIQNLVSVIAFFEDYELGLQMYRSFHSVDAPDCGLCADSSKALVNALRELPEAAGSKARTERIADNATHLHSIAAVQTAEGPAAVDLAGGQIFFHPEGEIRVEPFDEYVHHIRERSDGKGGITKDQIEALGRRAHQIQKEYDAYRWPARMLWNQRLKEAASNRETKRGEMRSPDELRAPSIYIPLRTMVQLGVRRESTKEGSAPEFLYQKVARGDFSFLASLPENRESFYIPPIPFSFSKNRPGIAAGEYLLVYKRESHQYRVVSIQDAEGQIQESAAFLDFVRQEAGAFYKDRSATGRYRYYAPTISDWGTIMEADGLVGSMAGQKYALSAEPVQGRQFALEPATERKETNTQAGILYRVAVPAAVDNTPEEKRSFYALAEVWNDQEKAWQSFEVYTAYRKKRGALPESINIPEYLAHRALAAGDRMGRIPGYRESLDALIGGREITGIALLPGGGFGDASEWWMNTALKRDANGKIIDFDIKKYLEPARLRMSPYHEGLDIFVARNEYGDFLYIPPGTGVRPVARGKVAAVTDDVMGQTVIVEHPDILNEYGDVSYSLYSHVTAKVKAGDEVGEESVIAGIADPGKAWTGAPPHLHFSMMWIPRDYEKVSGRPVNWAEYHKAFMPYNPYFMPFYLADVLERAELQDLPIPEGVRFLPRPENAARFTAENLLALTRLVYFKISRESREHQRPSGLWVPGLQPQGRELEILRPVLAAFESLGPDAAVARPMLSEMADFFHGLPAPQQDVMELFRRALIAIDGPRKEVSSKDVLNSLVKAANLSQDLFVKGLLIETIGEWGPEAAGLLPWLQFQTGYYEGLASRGWERAQLDSFYPLMAVVRTVGRIGPAARHAQPLFTALKTSLADDSFFEHLSPPLEQQAEQALAAMEGRPFEPRLDAVISREVSQAMALLAIMQYLYEQHPDSVETYRFYLEHGLRRLLEYGPQAVKAGPLLAYLGARAHEAGDEQTAAFIEYVMRVIGYYLGQVPQKAIARFRLPHIEGWVQIFQSLQADDEDKVLVTVRVDSWKVEGSKQSAGVEDNLRVPREGWNPEAFARKVHEYLETHLVLNERGFISMDDFYYGPLRQIPTLAGLPATKDEDLSRRVEVLDPSGHSELRFGEQSPVLSQRPQERIQDAPDLLELGSPAVPRAELRVGEDTAEKRYFIGRSRVRLREGYYLRIPQYGIYKDGPTEKSTRDLAAGDTRSREMVESALEYLWERAIANSTAAEVNTDLVHRVLRLEESTTLIAKDLGTYFFFSSEARGFGDPSRLSLRQRAIYLSKKFLENLDPSSKAHRALVALYLNRAQFVIDLFHKLYDEGYAQDAIYAQVRAAVSDADFMDKALLLDGIPESELDAFLAPLIHDDEVRREQEQKTITSRAKDVIAQANALEKIHNGIAAKGLVVSTAGLPAREEYNRIAHDLEEIGMLFQSVGQRSKALVFYRRAQRMYRHIREVDPGGLLPFRVQEEIIDLLLRGGMLDDFLEEFKNLLTGTAMPKPLIQIEPEILQSQLDGYRLSWLPLWIKDALPKLLYTLQVYASIYSGQEERAHVLAVIEEVGKIVNEYWSERARSLTMQPGSFDKRWVDTESFLRGTTLVPFWNSWKDLRFRWSRSASADGDKILIEAFAGTQDRKDERMVGTFTFRVSGGEAVADLAALTLHSETGRDIGGLEEALVIFSLRLSRANGVAGLEIKGPQERGAFLAALGFENPVEGLWRYENIQSKTIQDLPALRLLQKFPNGSALKPPLPSRPESLGEEPKSLDKGGAAHSELRSAVPEAPDDLFKQYYQKIDQPGEALTEDDWQVLETRFSINQLARLGTRIFSATAGGGFIPGKQELEARQQRIFRIIRERNLKQAPPVSARPGLILPGDSGTRPELRARTQPMAADLDLLTLLKDVNKRWDGGERNFDQSMAALHKALPMEAEKLLQAPNLAPLVAYSPHHEMLTLMVYAMLEWEAAEIEQLEKSGSDPARLESTRRLLSEELEALNALVDRMNREHADLFALSVPQLFLQSLSGYVTEDKAIRKLIEYSARLHYLPRYQYLTVALNLYFTGAHLADHMVAFDWSDIESLLPQIHFAIRALQGGEGLSALPEAEREKAAWALRMGLFKFLLAVEPLLIKEEVWRERFAEDRYPNTHVVDVEKLRAHPAGVALMQLVREQAPVLIPQMLGLMKEAPEAAAFAVSLHWFFYAKFAEMHLSPWQRPDGTPVSFAEALLSRDFDSYRAFLDTVPLWEEYQGAQSRASYWSTLRESEGYLESRLERAQSFLQALAAASGMASPETDSHTAGVLRPEMRAFLAALLAGAAAGAGVFYAAAAMGIKSETLRGVLAGLAAVPVAYAVWLLSEPFFFRARVRSALKNAEILDKGSYSFALTNEKKLPGQVLLLRRSAISVHKDQRKAVSLPQNTREAEEVIYRRLHPLGMVADMRYVGEVSYKDVSVTGEDKEALNRFLREKQRGETGDVFVQRLGVPLNKFINSYHPGSTEAIQKALAAFTHRLWQQGFVDLDLRLENYLVPLDHGKPRRDAQGNWVVQIHDLGSVQPLPADRESLQSFFLQGTSFDGYQKGMFFLRNLSKNQGVARRLFPGVDFSDGFRMIEEARAERHQGFDAASAKSRYLGQLQKRESQELLAMYAARWAHAILRVTKVDSRTELRNAPEEVSRDEIVKHPGWKVLSSQEGWMETPHVMERLLWNHRDLLEAAARSRRYSSLMGFLESLQQEDSETASAAARTFADDLWRRLPDWMMHHEVDYPTVLDAKDMRFSLFFRYPEQYAWFYQRILGFLEEQGRQAVPQPLKIDLIGPGYFQEPLTILALVKTAYEKTGMTLERVPFELNVFGNKEAPVFEMFRRGSLVFDRARIFKDVEWGFDRLGSDLEVFAESMLADRELFEKNLGGLLHRVTLPETFPEVVAPDLQGQAAKVWFDKMTLHEEYLRSDKHADRDFIFINSVFYYTHDRIRQMLARAAYERMDRQGVLFSMLSDTATEAVSEDFVPEPSLLAMGESRHVRDDRAVFQKVGAFVMARSELKSAERELEGVTVARRVLEIFREFIMSREEVRRLGLREAAAFLSSVLGKPVYAREAGLMPEIAKPVFKNRPSGRLVRSLNYERDLLPAAVSASEKLRPGSLWLDRAWFEAFLKQPRALYLLLDSVSDLARASGTDKPMLAVSGSEVLYQEIEKALTRRSSLHWSEKLKARQQLLPRLHQLVRVMPETQPEREAFNTFATSEELAAGTLLSAAASREGLEGEAHFVLSPDSIRDADLEAAALMVPALLLAASLIRNLKDPAEQIRILNRALPPGFQRQNDVYAVELAAFAEYLQAQKVIEWMA